MTCSSQPLRSRSVVILNDMYTSSDSFVNSRDMLCSSLSELNRRASSGLLERHYTGDSQSQDPNDYRIIEVEMGMFSPSGPKAKSVACLRGLAEEEGDRSVVMAPPKSSNWVLLRPSSVELLKDNRKEKARSMDELAPKRLKRFVHFEDNSTLHSSHLTSSTHCDRVEMLKPHLHSNVPLMRRRSLDDIIDLTQYGESMGIPRSHSYATLDVIPEDVALHDNNTLHDDNSLHDDNTLHDDNSLHLGSSTESGLHVLNNTNDEVDVSMETTESIAMVLNNGISDDEAIHGASSTKDSCDNLLQPGPLMAGRTSCAVHCVGAQETSFEEGFFPQNAAQSTEDEQCVAECQQGGTAAGGLQDTYQDMMAEGEEENDASSVSQTSMERTPPLRVKVSFTIIEEAERKVVKDLSPVSVGGLRGDFVPMPRSPQHNQGPDQSHDTASHTGGSPCVEENPPLNTSAASAEEHRDDHNSQTADRKGMLDRNHVHIIREIFLKHPQAEGTRGRCPQPALERGPQRKKSTEVLVKHWPQLLEEERRWVNGDADLLLCASVPTLDLTDSQIEGHSTSDPNLQASHQAVKVYSGSEEFTDGQTPSQPPVDAGSPVKQDLESFDWFSGVVTETLQFQMDRQDDATSDFGGGGGSHFELGDNSNSDDSTSDSTDSDDDGFVRPRIVSGLDLVSMTPPPRHPTPKSILNYNQMYLPTSGGIPKSAGDSQVSLEHRKVSTKPRMSIIQEEEEAIEELVRRM